MIEKYLFYADKKLNRHVDLSKLGIVFRNINAKEKSDIFNANKKIILEGKERELATRLFLYKTKKNKITPKKRNAMFDEIIALGEEKEKIIFDFYDGRIENALELFTLEEMVKRINNIIVVEIDLKEFTKHFGDAFIISMIKNIIDFSNYIGVDYEDFERYNGYVHEYVTSINENSMYWYAMLKMDFNKKIVLNDSVLKKLEAMIKEKDKNFGYNFLIIIDTIFESQVLVENRIISKISFLERLLSSKEESKSENFVLKVGILCNRLFDIPNERLSKQLKEIYNIRSLLVHGDEDKIVNNIDYYKKIFSDEITKGRNRYETRLNILWGVHTILELYFIRVLEKYLDNPHLCDYIKQN